MCVCVCVCARTRVCMRVPKCMCYVCEKPYFVSTGSQFSIFLPLLSFSPCLSQRKATSSLPLHRESADVTPRTAADQLWGSDTQ